jgi:hypothetical protein
LQTNILKIGLLSNLMSGFLTLNITVMENEKDNAPNTDQKNPHKDQEKQQERGGMQEDQKKEPSGKDKPRKASGGREQERGQQGGKQGAVDKKVTDRDKEK